MKTFKKITAAFLVVLTMLISAPFTGLNSLLPELNAEAASDTTCEKHQLGDWTVTKEPTCTEKGSRYAICNVCSTTFTEVLDKLPHKESEWITIADSTCVDEGLRQKFCTVCKEPLKSEIIAKKPHNESDWIIHKAATCTESGSRHTKCTTCNTVFKIESIKKIAHSYGEDGSCTMCGAACDHMCHQGGLLWTIVQFFLKLLKINPTCACGTEHY